MNLDIVIVMDESKDYEFRVGNVLEFIVIVIIIIIIIIEIVIERIEGEGGEIKKE